jgi:hypothetical protein
MEEAVEFGVGFNHVRDAFGGVETSDLDEVLAWLED